MARIAKSARVHPAALIDPEADVGEDVQIGPFVVIEGPVRIGPGCVIKTGAHLIGSLTMGRNNQVFSHAVVGEAPQHLKYAGEPTRLEIGDDNIFREHVTIHRGTTHSGLTKIGSNNFLMANSHVAHDCVIGNGCMFANGALLGGHCTVQDNVVISGNAAVHQFARIGRCVLMSGLSSTTMDLPPFMIHHQRNLICGVNVIGMRRAGLCASAIDAVRRAFHILYRSQMPLSHSLPRLEQDLGHVPEVQELVAFIRASKRGISLDCTKAEAA